MINTFTIPIKAVAKGRARHCRIGNGVRTYTPKKTVDFEKALWVYAKKYGVDEIPEDVAVHVEVCFEFKRSKSIKRDLHTVKPDLDNLLKSLFDGMFKRDQQITSIVASKIYGSEDAIHVHLKTNREI